MSTSTNSLSSTLASLGLTAPAASTAKSSSSNTLGQDDFMKLLIAQLKNQSPLNPQDSSEFASQMAQFGTASGIQDLQASFKDLSTSLLSNQTLQASSLVGRSVSVPNTNTAVFDNSGQGVNGTLVMTQPASNVQLSIKDSGGSVIKTVSLGSAAAGNVDFHWDGTMANGQTAPAGNYQVTATGLVNNTTTALNVAVASKVTSITVGNGGSGMMLNLANGGQTSFNNIVKLF